MDDYERQDGRLVINDEDAEDRKRSGKPVRGKRKRGTGKRVRACMGCWWGCGVHKCGALGAMMCGRIAQVCDQPVGGPES